MPRMNPYARLLCEIKEFAAMVKFPRRTTMWAYSAKDLKKPWGLESLRERVVAADQLGFDTQLRALPDGGLAVQYVKRVEVPFEWL